MPGKKMGTSLPAVRVVKRTLAVSKAPYGGAQRFLRWLSSRREAEPGEGHGSQQA